MTEQERQQLEALILNTSGDPYLVLRQTLEMLARWADGEGIPRNQYMAIAVTASDMGYAIT